MPAVVNVYTTKETKIQRHPFMDDPVFRHFFGERFDAETRKSTNLGSGVIVSEEGYILTNSHVVDAAAAQVDRTAGLVGRFADDELRHLLADRQPRLIT